MLTELKAPLAVVCHDAGAANIIYAWLHAADLRGTRLFASGPAAALWKQNPAPAVLCNSADEAVRDGATLLSGSGWGSDVEHEARRIAGGAGVFSVAVLDHWTNYRERFTRGDETVLPDEFWVTDEDARRIASECFPGQVVRVLPNLYLQEQLQKIDALDSGRDPELLYLLEPARSDWGQGTPGEFQALDYFAQHRPLLGLPANTVIRLRPHPSDLPGKYDAWIARQTGMKIVMDDSPDVSGAISRAAWVAGCETFALTIAIQAGRRVVCTLPPWAPPCRLPQRDLIHLQSLELAAK
jgi:hypothetical protein